jgi:hypothetical protein
VRVALENTQLFIGTTSDNDQAINLSLLPTETKFYQLCDGTKAVAAFCQIEHTTDKTQRCIQLITQVLAKLPQAALDTLAESPVYLLLPIFTKQHHDEHSDELNNFALALSQAFPQLFKHPLSQCFPFGRAAFPIALKSMSSLFSAEKVPSIIVLAVDSLYDQMNVLASNNKLITVNNEGCIVPSEGAIFCKIQPSLKGLNVDFTQQAIVPAKQSKQGIETLFAQVSAKLQQDNVEKKEKISSLYMPSKSEAELLWTEAYFHLADSVTKDTKILQNSLFTGELGSVTGLYNFLHIYNGYQNQGLTGIAGQLEVSETLYQGFSLYSWTD